MTRVSVTARMGIDQLPPFRIEISPMNCVGPRVEGRWRSSVNGFTTSTSPAMT